MLKRSLSIVFIMFSAVCLHAGAGERETGRVVAGRIDIAPVIDGVLDEACWNRAIEIYPFVLMASTDRAVQQTGAYISYDSENLYAAFRCEEFALDPGNNILHEFSMKVTEDNDAGIFGDDAVVLILDPGGGKVYDIFVNANAAVNSASGDRRNSWVTRDTGWGEGIEAAAEVENGFWTVEISVPFASLGINPSEGDVWGICLGRIQQREAERSSWQPMPAGFHMPEYFGEVVFGAQVPGIRVSGLWDYSHGEQELKVRVDPSGRRLPLRIESSVDYPGERSRVARSNHVLDSPGEISHGYYLEKEGGVVFRYSVLNPATLRTYYRSPAYRGVVSSTGLEILRVEGDPGYRIYLNGAELSGGSALYPGKNVLAIESAGKVGAEFGVGDYRFGTEGGWRYSAEAPEGWHERGYSDAGWEKRSADADGRLGMKGFYRRIILLDHSVFWPNWEKDGLYVAENSLQQMFLAPQGVEGYSIKDYSFYLEVPEEFKVIGASSYYDHLPSIEAGLDGAISRNGKEYSRYLIQTTDSVARRENIPLHNFISIVMELPESGLEFESRDAGEFYYYLKAGSGAIMEIPRSLRVNVLPPLRGVQPQRYIWVLYGGWLSSLNDEGLSEKIYKSFQRWGINEASFWRWHHENANLRHFGLTVGFERWNMDMLPYLEKNPGHALLDNEGVRRYMPGDARRNQVCTTLLLNDTPARAFMEETLTGLVMERKLDHVNWNYEQNVWDSYISCYCDTCLGEFRESAGIPGGTALDPGIIRGDYPAQWMSFMHGRAAGLADIFRGASREANPDVIFSVYSAYQSELHKETYGVDWSILGRNIDVAMCGYGRRIELLEDTLEALGGTPLVTGAIVYPYRVADRRYPTYISKARLLRRAVDGTGGVLFYMLSSFSGRTLYASSEISRLVAEYEDIFVKNRREDDLINVSGISSADAAVLADGNKRVVMLFNEGNSPRRARVSNRQLSRGARVYDYYGEKDLGRAESIETEIPPGDVKVYIIK